MVQLSRSDSSANQPLVVASVNGSLGSSSALKQKKMEA